LENIIYQADLGITFPDLYKKIFTENENIRNTIKWGIDFANNTKLYDEEDSNKLEMVSI
jgi:hypothetical protein